MSHIWRDEMTDRAARARMEFDEPLLGKPCIRCEFKHSCDYCYNYDNCGFCYYDTYEESWELL